jgi:hypothetical protein
MRAPLEIQVNGRAPIQKELVGSGIAFYLLRDSIGFEI